MNGNYKLYHYTMNNFNDIGFGCSYRNIQTILSSYKSNYKNNIKIPDIREILYYFDSKYQEKIDNHQTNALWIEPMQISKYLFNKFNIKFKNLLYIIKETDVNLMLKTNITDYLNNNEKNIYNLQDFDILINLMKNHFEISKLPIVIDNGIYSYCIGEINNNKITIIDPHTKTKENIIKYEDLNYIKKNFWMIYLPEIPYFDG